MTGRLPLGRLQGSIRVPGSKSAIIRALAMAALAPGRSHLYGADESDDTSAMVRVLRAMGVSVDTASEPWVVDGGRLRPPAEPLDCGESGLTARIAIGLATVLDGAATVTGRGRLTERPMRPLLDALRSQGVPVESPNGTLPVTVGGQGGLWGGEIVVPTAVSTQFLSALLLVAPTARYPVSIRLEDRSGALGYVDMTTQLMGAFGAKPIETTLGYEIPNGGYQPADCSIPADASSAAYPSVGAAITEGDVEVLGVSLADRQPDLRVLEQLVEMGCSVSETSRGVRLVGPEALAPVDADMEGAPDGALALAVACVFASGPSRITGLSSLRHKESNRLEAISDGLGLLGADVRMSDDALEIRPGPLVGARVRSHGDHRIAMSLALVGLRVEGVEVEDPAVVTKTWPRFWEELGALVFSVGER